MDSIYWSCKKKRLSLIVHYVKICLIILYGEALGKSSPALHDWHQFIQVGSDNKCSANNYIVQQLIFFLKILGLISFTHWQVFKSSFLFCLLGWISLSGTYVKLATFNGEDFPTSQDDELKKKSLVQDNGYFSVQSVLPILPLVVALSICIFQKKILGCFRVKSTCTCTLVKMFWKEKEIYE